jgi:CHASE2 domain-containing sensor protein/signal transduction histidine kinase
MKLPRPARPHRSSRSPPRLSPRLSLRNEWIFLLVLTLIAAMLLSQASTDAGGLGRADRIVYDRLMEAAERPAAENIVIIAIDDKSIAALGRWPWTRATHAQLLNVLANADPKAIGMDILLTESEAAQATSGAGHAVAANAIDTAGDHALAAAIAKNARTVLPVLLAQSDAGLQAIPPRPEFEKAAAWLAHIHLNFDADGVVRSTYLYEAIDGRRWPEFSLAMLLTGGDTEAFSRTQIKLDADRANRADHAGQPPQSLERSSLMRIPFSGPPGHFQTVSYIDVLSGAIPAAYFKDKYVLVGATAVGSGDVFPTPLAAQDGLMSGVEMHANLLAALMQGRSIDSASAPLAFIFTALPAVLILVGFIFMSPRMALLLTAVYAVAVGLASYAAFQHGVWIAPSGALLLLFLIYPVWSWRRLETALNYLNEEVARLGADAPYNANETNPAAGRVRIWDFLERRIEAMRLAARRMRDLHRFVSDNLDSMPDANLVIDNDGVLMLHNRKAQDLFASLNLTLTRGCQVDDLLAPFQRPVQTALKNRPWRELLAASGDIYTDAYTDLNANARRGIETTDGMNRLFLIKSSPSQKANGDPLGWIVSLADITSLRATERLRDESLNFISHDMRAPQSSILAMLELQRTGAKALALDELFARIEKSVRSTLSLADDFVQLAKAESKDYQLEETDFVSLLADATDEMWALASARGVRLMTAVAQSQDAESDVESDVDQYWVRVDRTLMTRVLCNLLSNAIKYGPADAEVHCELQIVWQPGAVGQVRTAVQCTISDQGGGIAEDDSALLFTPFYRAGRSGQGGAGLGLAFVKTVMEQHGGTVAFINRPRPGQGAMFVLTLPCV